MFGLSCFEFSMWLLTSPDEPMGLAGNAGASGLSRACDALRDRGERHLDFERTRRGILEHPIRKLDQLLPWNWPAADPVVWGDRDDRMDRQSTDGGVWPGANPSV